MSIKQDLVLTKANFISFKELIEKLVEIEGIATIDVVAWLLNADSVQPAPSTYECYVMDGRLCFYKEGDFSEYLSLWNENDDLDDEQGFIRREIIYYLREMGVDYPEDNEEFSLPQFMSKAEMISSLENGGPDELAGKGELKRREYQHEVILAVIAALNFHPQQIPDGGKAKIRNACLTRPRIFTDASFDHAWKDGIRNQLFRLANHEKYSQQKVD